MNTIEYSHASGISVPEIWDNCSHFIELRCVGKEWGNYAREQPEWLPSRVIVWSDITSHLRKLGFRRTAPKKGWHPARCWENAEGEAVIAWTEGNAGNINTKGGTFAHA